jgi:hypothetical protein
MSILEIRHIALLVSVLETTSEFERKHYSAINMCIVVEILIGPQLSLTSPPRMEPEASTPCSQKPTNGSDELTPFPINFIIILLSVPRSQSSLQVFQLKMLYAFLALELITNYSRGHINFTTQWKFIKYVAGSIIMPAFPSR